MQQSLPHKRTLFLAEGVSQLSHTFIRADIESKSARDVYQIVDIEEFSISHALTVKSAAFWIFDLLYMAFTLRYHFIKMFCNKNWRGVLNATFIYSSMSRSLNLNMDTLLGLRCHFLAKASIVCFIIHKIHGTPYSVVCHGSDLYALPKSLDRILIAASNIECVTYFGKGVVFGRLKGKAIGKVRVTRNRIGREFYTNDYVEPDIQTNGIRLLMIARLVPQKDVEFSLKVVKEIFLHHDPKVSLTLVGDGPLRASLQQMAADLGIEACVQFEGDQPNYKIDSYLSAANAFILPCREESLREADGLPVVFQEALSFGLPVFCRKAFGVDEFIIQGVNGFSYEITDKEEIWAQSIVDFVPTADRSEIAKLAKHQF